MAVRRRGARWRAIVVKWRRLGGQGGFLGVPLAAEAPTGDGTGRLQRFAGGFVAWHPDTGAFSLHGAIAQRWLVLGAERYGYPITDELAAPDGLGRFNHFRAPQFDGAAEASIYWTAATGAGVVLALTHDGRLLRNEHRGWLDGGPVETWLGSQELASGIRSANVMFALMPASAAAAPPVR